MPISLFLVERIRSRLIEARDGFIENGPCGYPRNVALPWFCILWEQKGVGWMARDIRDGKNWEGRFVL